MLSKNRTMFGAGTIRPPDATAAISSSPSWCVAGAIACSAALASAIAEPQLNSCRGDYDKDISKLLEDIPRATSAPPHLQDRWAVVSAGGAASLLSAMVQPAVSPSLPPCSCPQPGGPDLVDAATSRGWTPIQHSDIRYDEDYARFYEAYSGQKKLPPPVDGRTLYNDLPALLQQQKQLQAAQHAALLTSATPPPSQAALLMGGGLNPGGDAAMSNACTCASVICPVR